MTTLSVDHAAGHRPCPVGCVAVLVSALQGAALDWAVAAALEKQFSEGRVIKICRLEPTLPAWIERENSPGSAPYYHRFGPSTDPACGHNIIEREDINTVKVDDESEACWQAYQNTGMSDEYWVGPTILIAAMRCYVASILGNEVFIPLELAA